jgi:hypothetical protein
MKKSGTVNNVRDCLICFVGPGNNTVIDRVTTTANSGVARETYSKAGKRRDD